MTPLVLSFILAVAVVLTGFAVSVTSQAGGRSNGPAIALIASIIIGVGFGTLTHRQIERAEQSAHRTGVMEGLQEGYYSGVPEREMEYGSIYQFLGCVSGESGQTVLRDPHGRTAIFQVKCQDQFWRPLEVREFYEFTRLGLEKVE